MIDIAPIDLTEWKQKHVDRFWARVNKTETCWLWTGFCNEKGYGKYIVCGVAYRTHRLAYYFRHKIDPFPHLVLHKCNNPSCCNPEHLYLGTPLDNSIEMVSLGRTISKLTKNDIIHIRELLETNYQYKVAEMFGVSQATINNIYLHKLRIYKD